MTWRACKHYRKIQTEADWKATTLSLRGIQPQSPIHKSKLLPFFCDGGDSQLSTIFSTTFLSSKKPGKNKLGTWLFDCNCNVICHDLRFVLSSSLGRLLSKLSESFTALCSQAPLRPADEAPEIASNEQQKWGLVVFYVVLYCGNDTTAQRPTRTYIYI